MTSNRLLQECLEDFTDILRLPMALYDQTETVWQERSRSRRTRRHLKISVIRRQICRHWETAAFSE